MGGGRCFRASPLNTPLVKYIEKKNKINIIPINYNKMKVSEQKFW